MISALLLPLFLAGTPASIGGAPRGDPPIRLWINHDGRFLPGDHAKVQVRTKDDGYLLVLHADPDGQLRVLFPLDPDDDNFVRGGERFDVEGRGGREAVDIDGTAGRGMVYAAVSRDRFRFDGYRLGDHWDYRALAPSRLPREPESELTELVRRMAQGDFDYDVLTYDVIERVVYASGYSSVPGNFDVPGLDDPRCSGFSSGFGCVRPFSSPGFVLSAGFFFGRPFRRFDSPFLFAFDGFFFDPFFHRRVFFDPFFNPFFFDPLFFDPFFHRGFFFRGFFFDPFFDPFFFDPFLHRGVFFDPFFRRPLFHQPVLVDRFFHRPFSRPFLFRPRGLAPIPFRDRRNDFRRAVNTVDLTPWWARGAATASRGRRVEFRSEGPARLAVAGARQRAIQARRADWPVDVSPRRREPVTQARRDNWPVDVSPGRREPVTQARRDNWPVDVSPRRREPATEAPRANWPVDVSPRRRDPDLPTGRRAVDDRPAGLRPQIDGTSLPEARRARQIEDRSGLEMASPDRGGWESFSLPSDRGSDRGTWSPPFDGGGDRGFAPSARPSDGGGRGASRRR
jgi:hypothetical protein